MPRFFVNEPIIDIFKITGDDAFHIMKSLRMKVNELIVLCHNGMDYICKIIDFDKSSVLVKLIEKKVCDAEPCLKVTLFQGIPKGDKMDLIVQKAVEVGVCNIIPVITERCISRPDERSLTKKVQRWQKIALEAAKQSGRGIIPEVKYAAWFSDAVNLAGQFDKVIVFYEGGGIPIYKAIGNMRIGSIAIFIGPEGGFEQHEVDMIKNVNGDVCSLGNRILRTETAAIVSTALIIYEHERLKVMQ